VEWEAKIKKNHNRANCLSDCFAWIRKHLTIPLPRFRIIQVLQNLAIFELMFTGIIECQGTIERVRQSGTNVSFWINSSLSPGLKIDQSLAHDGVCLTVEAFEDNTHQVTAIAETISKTTLATWSKGRKINLERCLEPGSRLDGHFVQGHVDCQGLVLEKTELGGSWGFKIQFPHEFAALVIEKGSITVNGISLTAFNVGLDNFEVAIIPYTYLHTNLQFLNKNERVNLEFDLIGKYIIRWQETKG
jgi:riboflavin synthase